MLGYDDSKDNEGGGLLSQAASVSRWSVMRLSKEQKICGGISLLVAGVIAVGLLASPGEHAAPVVVLSACATAAYGQCGGTGFTGDSCCPDGSECVLRSADYSQCSPACLNEAWGQCGGKDFLGSSCCPGSHSCVLRSVDFSQCVPQSPAVAVPAVAAVAVPAAVPVAAAALPLSDPGCTTKPWTQCGGKKYTGAKCCPDGYHCTFRTEDYSQCARD
tara:strand:+ start:163 stop:813 length:651 start_codon:yes stop_codon:yes gene_type:complete